MGAACLRGPTATMRSPGGPGPLVLGVRVPGVSVVPHVPGLGSPGVSLLPLMPGVGTALAGPPRDGGQAPRVPFIHPRR